jgi:hypothetical protein
MKKQNGYLQFNRRDEDHKHTDSIERPSSAGDGDVFKKTDDLIKDVFKGHPAAYNEINEKGTNPDLAKRFYNKYYSEPQIKRKGYANHIAIDDFIENVFLDATNANKNKISFLLGSVGVGKTAFVNYIISKHFPDTKYKEKFIFIRIDVEYQEKKNMEDIGKFIIDKFIWIVNKDFKDLLLKDTTLKGHIDTLSQKFMTEDERERNFRTIIEYLYTRNNKIKLALIIDNIDIIYHRTKINFFDTEDNRDMTNKIDNLVKYFVENINEHFDSLYANVLFVMRGDTFEYMKHRDSTDNTTSRTNIYITHNCFSIEEYKWDDILKKRFKMLRDLIDEKYNPGEMKEKIIDRIDKISEYLELGPKSNNLISTIQKLTNAGLREMMDYLNSYSYISYYSSSRFFEKVPVALMAFILSGNQLYSDKHSVITNVFMNYDIETFKPITYWLKYFIIRYLNKRTSSKTETTKQDIYNIFSNQEQEKAYNQECIDMILKTLTNSNQSNIIEVKKTYVNPKKDKLTLKITEKGTTIINEMVFKFYYLQLMVDDHLLALPEILQTNDLYKFEKSTGYSYLLLKDDEYTKTATTIIKEKGKAVIYFLTLLKCALDYEKEKYSDVFKNLSAVGVNLPPIDAVINSVKGELRSLNSSGNITPFTPDIEAYFRAIDHERETIETEIRKIYNNL